MATSVPICPGEAAPGIASMLNANARPMTRVVAAEAASMTSRSRGRRRICAHAASVPRSRSRSKTTATPATTTPITATMVSGPASPPR
jgi:hypothetical protein